MRIQAVRTGQSTAVVALAAVVVVLLVALVYLLATRGNTLPATASTPLTDTPVVAAGQSLGRDEALKGAKAARAPTEPVGDPATVRGALAEGAVYRVIQKAGFAARGQDTDWGSREVIKVGLAAEQVYTRRIESNDGKRVVEVREYEYHRAVKILSGAEDFTVDPGEPAVAVLGKVDGLPRRGVAPVADPGAILRAVIRPDPTPLVVDPTTKVYGSDGMLTGKRVRVTSVDGKGVISVEPLGCDLNAWERDHLFNKDMLATARFVAEQGRLAPGNEATLPGTLFSEFIELVDAEAAPRVQGQVVVRREPDSAVAGRKLAALTVLEDRSELRVSEDAPDAKLYGSFRPAGRLTFWPDDRMVREAVLDARSRIEAAPAGGPLGRTLLLDEPRVKFTYQADRR